MARTNRSGELFSQISEVGIIKDKTGTFGNTTLTAAAAVGATTLTVAAITNFADTDLIRMGAENEYEFGKINGAPAGSTLTPLFPVKVAHASGDPVVEVAKTKLGEASDQGVQIEGFDGDFNAINAATRRQVFGYLPGHVAPMISFALHNWNLENILTSLGMNEATQIQTASARDRVVLKADDFGELGLNLAFYFLGVRKDGKNIEVQAWGTEIDFTQAFKGTLARGEGFPLPFVIRPTSALQVEIF